MRKREETTRENRPEERRVRAAQKRRKRNNILEDGELKRRRKVQRVRKPRCAPGSAAHLSQLPAIVGLSELSDSLVAGAIFLLLAEPL